jgi:hypothetical protein
MSDNTHIPPEVFTSLHKERELQMSENMVLRKIQDTPLIVSLTIAAVTRGLACMQWKCRFRRIAKSDCYFCRVLPSVFCVCVCVSYLHWVSARGHQNSVGCLFLPPPLPSRLVGNVSKVPGWQNKPISIIAVFQRSSECSRSALRQHSIGILQGGSNMTGTDCV